MRCSLGALGSLCLTLALAIDLTALAQPTDTSYFGTWTLNVGKSTYSPGPPPKSSTRTHEDLGNGSIRVTTQGVNAQGNPTYSQYTYKLDGRDYPIIVKGSESVTTVALRSVDAFTASFTNKLEGTVTSTGIRTVSKDGRTMTITTKGKSAQGQPMHNVTVWEKK